MRHRDQLHLKCNKNLITIILLTTCKRYKNFCNDLPKRLKTKYEKQLLIKYSNDPKMKWKIINMITNSHNNKKNSTSNHLLKAIPRIIS